VTISFVERSRADPPGSDGSASSASDDVAKLSVLSTFGNSTTSVRPSREDDAPVRDPD